MTEATNVKTLVLLEAELETLGGGIDLHTVQQWLREAVAAVCVHVVPHLSQRPGELARTLVNNSAARLVLGLCSDEYAVASMQAQARKAGLDPLGIEVVNLGASAALVHSRPQAVEKAKIMLAAAIARARAFAGSTPEHAKLYFSTHVSRRSLLQLSLPAYRAAPAIEASLCAADLGCKACVQVCPQTALTWADGSIRYDKATCEPCGLCVTACPRGAISNPTITPAQLTAQISTLLDPSMGDIQPRGIVFTCQRTPAPEGPWHEGWMPVKIPCIGMAPPAWFLAPLLLGASAVGVFPCHRGCSLNQDTVIAGRVSYCQELLKLIGATAEMMTLAPALDQSPRGEGKHVPLAGLFDHTGTVNVLKSLVQAYHAPSDSTLAHPHSPLGIVDIRADVCTGCGMCAMVCPTEALDFTQQEGSVSLSFDATLCTACGQCLPKCPEAAAGAITLARRTDIGRIGQGRTSVYQEETARCVTCGASIAPRQMLRRIEAVLGSPFAATMPFLTQYCLACRSTAVLQAREREDLQV